MDMVSEYGDILAGLRGQMGISRGMAPLLASNLSQEAYKNHPIAFAL
jgi:hypothetical protein